VTGRREVLLLWIVNSFWRPTNFVFGFHYFKARATTPANPADLVKRLEVS